MSSLSERIRAAKTKLNTPDTRREQPLAWHFLSELVAGMLVGGGIGWLLDGVFASKPLCFIVFLLLGVAGAFWNMMRLAQKNEIVHTERE